MVQSYEEYLEKALLWTEGMTGKQNTFFMRTKSDAVKLKNYLKNNGFECGEIIWQTSFFSGFKFSLLKYNKKCIK